MKEEYLTGTRIWIKAISKFGFDARGFITERKRSCPCGKAIRQPFAVFRGLDLNAGEGRTGLLCFDHPGSFAVHVEEVVSEAVVRLECKIPKNNTAFSLKIGALRVLNSPACRHQHAVNLLTGYVFGALGHYELKIVQEGANCKRHLSLCDRSCL
jgi:hypothetical protein